MRQLNKKVLNRLKQIVKTHTEVLMTFVTGEGRPSPELLAELDLPKEITDLIDTFYKYGKVRAATRIDFTGMSDPDIDAALDAVTLTHIQRRSIEMTKIRAAAFLERLSQQIETDVVSEAVKSDITMWNALSEETPNAIRESLSREKFRQVLREKTQDWNRDWHRVAHTELWEAKCQGEAQAIMHGESVLSREGAGTTVYKSPNPDACPKCKELFLEADGVTPKTFNIQELIANGDNVGKKRADWKPVIGCVHPNCHCVLMVKPPNTVFDERGRIQYRPRGAVT